MIHEHRDRRAAGYASLVERYELDVVPNWHRSEIAPSAVRRTDRTGPEVIDTYPERYWPGDTPGDHLEFALKYDGTNLALLASILPAVGPDEVTRFVQTKPTGKYARRL
ncbi:MAG: hypothetical protein KDA28_16540, partial [Phycisphaerales bacterium]|nr:hypothetical protein [Phycisphaerales bacterium]